jgi:Polysaccharide pyruvyl transferase
MNPIQILGWYNHGNIGDEAYKLAFPILFPDNEFNFSENIKGTPDTIILGGGDVFSSKFLDMLKKYPDAKKYALSVNLRSENLDGLDQFTKVICRNNIVHPKVSVMPDFTFILQGDVTNGKKLIKELFDKYKAELYENVVILTLNCFLCSQNKLLGRDYVTFEKICYDLAKLMDETSASFILMPFGNGFPQNDRISNGCVYVNTKFYNKNVLVFDELTVQQTLDIYAAADAAITTRLHAAIFSCIGGTPMIDITHHTKNKMFMEFIGKEEWSIDYWHFNFHKTKALLHSFLKDKSVKEGLVEITNNARSQLKSLDIDLSNSNFVV